MGFQAPSCAARVELLIRVHPCTSMAYLCSKGHHHRASPVARSVASEYECGDTGDSMSAMTGPKPTKLRRQALRMCAPLIGACCVSLVAEAHHSRALYDTTQEVVI